MSFCLVYRSKGKSNWQRQPTNYEKVKGTFFIQFPHKYDNHLMDGSSKNNKNKYPRTIPPE